MKGFTWRTMDPNSDSFRCSCNSVYDDTGCVEQASGDLPGSSDDPSRKILKGLTSKAN